MTSSAPLVLKWNDANTISVNKPGTDSSISFVNDGSARKIGAYYTDSGASKTSFELSHGTQSQFLMNKADGATAALKFSTNEGTNNSNELYIYNAGGKNAVEVSTNVGDNASSNQINIYNSTPFIAFRFSTDSGDNNTSNEFYIYDSSSLNAFGFRTDKDGNNDTNEFAGYTHNETEYFKFSAKVGDDTSNRFDIYRAIGSYALSFLTDVGANKSNQFYIRNASEKTAFEVATDTDANHSNKLYIYNNGGNDAFGFSANNSSGSKLFIKNAASTQDALVFESDLNTSALEGNRLQIHDKVGFPTFILNTGDKDSAYYGSNSLSIYCGFAKGVSLYTGAASKSKNGMLISNFRTAEGQITNEYNGIELMTNGAGETTLMNAINIYDITSPQNIGVRIASDILREEETNVPNNNIIFYRPSSNQMSAYLNATSTETKFGMYNTLGFDAIRLDALESSTNISIGNGSGYTAFQLKTNIGSNGSNQFTVYDSNTYRALEFMTGSGSGPSNEFHIYSIDENVAFLFESNAYNGSSYDMAKFSIYKYEHDNSPAIELASNIQGSNWYHGSVLSFYNHEDEEAEAKLAIELGTGVDMAETNNASALRFYNVNKTDSQPEYALEYIARDYNTTADKTILNHLKINSNAGPYLELATDGGFSSSGSEPGFGIRILEKDKPEIVKLYCNNSTSKVRFQLGDGVNADSGFIFNTLDTTLGASSTRNLFVIRRPSSTANAFMFSSTESNSNDFTIYNSETVASTTLTTNININNKGIVLPLKFQSADTTVPTGTNGEGICVFDSEALTATSADATKTAMLKRTVPSTYAVQQALNSRFNIAPFELEVTTDAQGNGVKFRIKLPAAHSSTNQDQYYDFDFSAKTHGYNP